MNIKIKKHDSAKEDGLVAIISFHNWNANSAEFESLSKEELWKTIFKRHTNRTISLRKKVNRTLLKKLNNLASESSFIDLHICENSEDLLILEDIIGSSDRLRLMHPRGYHDLFVNELRLTKAEAEEKRDGVDIRTVDLNLSEKAGINIAKDSEAINYLRKWNLGTGFEKISRKAVRSSSAIGLVTVSDYGKISCLNAGRIIQDLWLMTNSLNVGFHPLCVPIMFFARLTEGKGENLSPQMKAEVREIRTKFLSVFPFPEERKEIFMFRLCIADKPTVRSLRRPVDKILSFD